LEVFVIEFDPKEKCRMNKYRTIRMAIMQVCSILPLILLTVASAGAQSSPTPPAAGQPLFTVTHDATLQGAGTRAAPLGVEVPLNLNGALTVNGLIKATPDSGNAIEANGSTDQRGNGASGVNVNGGKGQG